MIRILLVDDHALLRESVARLLSAEPDFAIAPPCSSLDQAFRTIGSTPVDLVLLDYDLGTERGTEFFGRARDIGFRGRVLVVTAGLSDSDAVRLLSHGASGIFLKHSPPDLLAQSIRMVMNGEAWIDQSFLSVLLRARVPREEDPGNGGLTVRERDVLRRLLEGLSNKEIASTVGVSESSVKATLQNLFNKLGVRTRSQLVRIALEKLRDQL